VNSDAPVATGFANRDPLWYNNGVWGQLGYAVPNWGTSPTTINSTIFKLVRDVGRNLQAIMNCYDADLTRPPSINVLTKIRNLINRVRNILAARAVAPAKPDLVPVHASPSEQAFLLFPSKYFLIRNPFLQEYCGLILTALTECMLNTENRKPLEISTDFAQQVTPYFQRVYTEMAIELFQVAVATAQAADFVLTDAILQTYNPGAFYTLTEASDAVAPLNQQPGPHDLGMLALGIPATQIIGIACWPDGSVPAGVTLGSGPAASTGAASTTGSTAAATPAIGSVAPFTQQAAG
jgi:RNAse (barnase) inhibitor barstar